MLSAHRLERRLAGTIKVLATNEHGRGLMMVHALSARVGVCGDHRGRLVWADVAWTADEALPSQPVPDTYETAIRDGQTALAKRFSGVAT